MTRIRTTVFALFSLVCGTQTARAGDVATAHQLFLQGRAYLDAGDYALACPKLEASYAEEPATGSLLALALCQEKAGKTASAWSSFAEAAARARRDRRADREKAAREHVTALEAKLSRLTVEVDPVTSAVEGLVVARDGVVLPAAAWGVAIPLDPGEHSVSVTAPGRQSWTAQITLGATADRQVLLIPELKTLPAAILPAERVESTPPTRGSLPGGRSPASPAATHAEQKPAVPLRPIGAFSAGAGILGVAVSGYFGLRANSLKAESKEDGHCNAANQCDPAGGAKRDSARHAATASTVSFVVGTALTATGVTLWILGTKEHADTARLQATAAVGPRDGGLILRGAF